MEMTHLIRFQQLSFSSNISTWTMWLLVSIEVQAFMKEATAKMTERIFDLR